MANDFIGNLPKHWANKVMHQIICTIETAKDTRPFNIFMHSGGGVPCIGDRLQPTHSIEYLGVGQDITHSRKPIEF